MTQKHQLSDTQNHPLWAMINFIQYGLDRAIQESRPPSITSAPSANSQKWLLDHLEGAVLCLQLARDSVDDLINPD